MPTIKTSFFARSLDIEDPAPSGWLVGRGDGDCVPFGLLLDCGPFVLASGAVLRAGSFADAFVGTGVGVAFGAAFVGRGVAPAAVGAVVACGRVGAGVGVGVDVGFRVGVGA